MRSLVLFLLLASWLAVVFPCGALELESLFFSTEGVSESASDAASTTLTALSKDAKVNSTGSRQVDPPPKSPKRLSNAAEPKQAQASAARPPNVVFIVADQLRYDALGFIQARMQRYQGKLRVRTPFLDQLARQGANFATTYCVAPSCGPSRAGIKTGCALQRTGVLDNRCFNDKVLNRMDIIADRINRMVSFEQILVEKVRVDVLILCVIRCRMFRQLTL